MKAWRVASMVGLVVVLLGVFGLANTLTYPCNYNACLTIPKDLDVTCGGTGTLDFESEAMAADATGVFYTNAVQIIVKCNADLDVNFKLGPLITSGGHTLKTDVTWYYKYKGGTWVGPITYYAPPPVDKTITFLHAKHKGELTLEVKVSVERKGYADFHGSYSCSLDLTFTADC